MSARVIAEFYTLSVAMTLGVFVDGQVLLLIALRLPHPAAIENQEIDRCASSDLCVI